MVKSGFYLAMIHLMAPPFVSPAFSPAFPLTPQMGAKPCIPTHSARKLSISGQLATSDNHSRADWNYPLFPARKVKWRRFRNRVELLTVKRRLTL
jgi:hypothetical protein